ncbi:tyrosine-type recombinase/integrase [Cupriavidus sp. SK-3]|uniref:tyrosine-type recombinase/integrase n=1 Tax=Cupriavidus sp. SK-3 TaxID=1470558 RepID=UPI0039C8892E
MGDWCIRDFFEVLRDEFGLTASCHCIRHTTGTNLLRATNNSKIVQNQLDHTDLKTTMLHVHPDVEDQRLLVEHLSTRRGLLTKGFFCGNIARLGEQGSNGSWFSTETRKISGELAQSVRATES